MSAANAHLLTTPSDIPPHRTRPLSLCRRRSTSTLCWYWLRPCRYYFMTWAPPRRTGDAIQRRDNRPARVPDQHVVILIITTSFLRLLRAPQHCRRRQWLRKSMSTWTGRLATANRSPGIIHATHGRGVVDTVKIFLSPTIRYFLHLKRQGIIYVSAAMA